MEDISRELEREIARAKPKPHKTNPQKKVLVVDDFGRMRSGGYLRIMVRCLAVTSLVFGLAAVGLYVLYSRLSEDHVQVNQTLVQLEAKVKRLTEDKEILMARLVMVGEKPMLSAATVAKDADKAAGAKPASTDAKTSGSKDSGNAANVSEGTKQVADIDVPRVEALDKEPKGQGDDAPVAQDVQDLQEGIDPADSPEDDLVDEADADGSEVVRIEKFSLSKISDRDELRVRFNIRNVKKGPGEISGRIFLVLKPVSGTETDWLVVPKASIKDGVPSDIKRGQYFSISRFKPVRFTINSPANFKALASAVVYIFSEEGELMYKDIKPISVEEES